MLVDVIRDNAGVTEQPTVELHIVSDSTGETAARLVLALEAQFPEQEFEEVRHTRAETVDDLERAVAELEAVRRTVDRLIVLARG